jgi:peptidylprolyl isomerase
MKHSITSTILLGAAALALPLAAQTTTSSAKSTAGSTASHTATAAHAVRCATPAPHEPQNIPALPSTAPCPKALYTLTTVSPTRLVYASPLLSPGVHDMLASGPMTFSLDYVDTVAGTGEAVKAGKYISVKYTGYLSMPGSKQDGNKFDSTEDHPGKQAFPIEYGNHAVIEGWDTGFEGMRVGGKRRLYIPWQLAYGERGRGPIPAKADLIFDLEVVGQSDTAPAPPARPMPPVHPGAAPGSAAQPPASTTPPPAGATQPAKPQ